MRTGTVSYRLEDLKNGVIIPIGFVGENDFTKVFFDAEEIYKKYPNASVSMKVQPPKGVIYPAAVTRDGNTVIWQVKEADVANRGGGELQLTFTDGETKIKTYIAKTDVKRSLAGNGPAPDTVQDWIDDADEKLAEVEQALDDLAAMDNIAKTAQASDIGKALSPKTVENGVVTEWEYITPGGGTEDYTDLDNKPSIAGVTLSGNKTLEDLGIAAADDLDNMANDVTDVKTAIHGMNTATASDVGKALSPKTVADGKVTEWQFVSGGGTVTGDQISDEYIQVETENLIGTFTDNKYATGVDTSVANTSFSFATADIESYEYVILTSYTTPDKVNYPFVFYNSNGVISRGRISEYETVDTDTYKIQKPSGATNVHINVYKTQKGVAVCKGIKKQKSLKWFELQMGNIPESVLADIVEEVSDNFDVKPTVIDGTKREYGGEAPTGITTQNGFYTMKEEGADPGFNSSLTHFEFSVQENDIIETYIGADVDVISQSLKNNYFTVVDSDGKCTKAFDVTIDSNYIYRLRIPENGATCYITKYGTGENAYVKLYKDTFVLDWLLLKTNNFYPNTIPEECIIREVPKIAYIHGESIEKPFNFSSKKILLFGDSIAAGIANEGQGNISAGVDSWINKFVAKVGATLSNNAIGGASIAHRDDEGNAHSVYTQITTTTEAADFIFIAGGTNDYNQQVNVGSYGDTTKYTTYGALHLICEYLQTQYPDVPVIFITPINVTKDMLNVPRVYLNKYRNAIYEVATSYGYNVVNGIDLVPVEKGTGWDTEFIKYVDGTHPTLKGHAMYFKNMCMKLL